MSVNRYATMSSATLKILLDATVKELLAATIADDGAKQTTAQKVITEVEQAIEGKADSSQSTDSKGGDKFDKSLDRDIRERVGRIAEFGPASDVSIFLREARVVFNTLVKGGDARLEKEFCRKLKMRLCNTYLEKLDRQATTVDTFDDLVKYMDLHHMSKKSAYQYMATISELERRPDENIKDFALKVEAEVDRVATVVQAKFNKAKTDEAKIKAESGTPAAATDQMTAKDVFTMLAGSVVLAEVKKDTSTYNAIINDLDKCWSGREIALKAQAVSDRISKATESIETINVNFAKSTGATSPSLCYAFIQGQTCAKDPCTYTHDDRLRDIFIRQSDQSQQQPGRERICYEYRDKGFCSRDNCHYEHVAQTAGRD